MSTEDKITRFAHLNETNYPEWVIRMEATLIRLGLWEVVMYEGDLDGSEEDVKKSRESWLKKRTAKKMSDARAEIVLRVEDSQLAHMRERDPEVIWRNLAQVHVARGFATRLALQRQFLRLVKGEKESMAAWVGRVKGFSFRLEDIGVEVSDEDRILALTNGLDNSWDSFVMSLDAMAPELLKMTHVVDRLLNEEMRRESRDEETVSGKSEKVYVAKGDSGSGSGGLGAARTCWRCGEAGHIKMFCKSKPKEEEKKQETAHLALGAGMDVSQLKDLGAREIGQLF